MSQSSNSPVFILTLSSQGESRCSEQVIIGNGEYCSISAGFLAIERRSRYIGLFASLPDVCSMTSYVHLQYTMQPSSCLRKLTALPIDLRFGQVGWGLGDNPRMTDGTGSDRDRVEPPDHFIHTSHSPSGTMLLQRGVDGVLPEGGRDACRLMSTTSTTYFFTSRYDTGVDILIS